MKNLNQKLFTNIFTSAFKGQDFQDSPPRQTPDDFYAKVHPQKVPSPKLWCWSQSLASELNISAPTSDDEKILCGNLITETMIPYASRYGGHQFGHWAGQLGDGRAICLGEVEGQELQLKGSGLTAYSRHADGKAVLRSSIREYLMSEAMFHLNIPTTRALSLMETGEKVLRDMFYDGNPEYEPGAVVARVAPTFLRFGHFEILFYNNKFDDLRSLKDWTLTHHFKNLLLIEDESERTLQFFKKVAEDSLDLIIHWMRVGFTHGVMNTDNMSVLGLTIDYGPYGMLDEYDPAYTPNTSDLPGRRYAFGNQASALAWNLSKFALSLCPLVDEPKELEKTLNDVLSLYQEKFVCMMSNKLGLKLDANNSEDMDFLQKLEVFLIEHKYDYTLFFKALTSFRDIHQDKSKFKEELILASYLKIEDIDNDVVERFLIAYEQREKADSTLMKKANPSFILKNFALYQASKNLEKGNDRPLKELEELLLNPYDHSIDSFKLLKRPEWTKKEKGSCALSCSS